MCFSGNSPFFPAYFVLWFGSLLLPEPLLLSALPPSSGLFLTLQISDTLTSYTSLPELNTGHSHSWVQSPLASRQKKEGPLWQKERSDSPRLSPDLHVHLSTPHIIIIKKNWLKIRREDWKWLRVALRSFRSLSHVVRMWTMASPSRASLLHSLMFYVSPRRRKITK